MAHSQLSAPKTLAAVFLARIPATERKSAVQDLAASLHNSSDHATAELVAELLQSSPDENAKRSFHQFLANAIRNGETQHVAKLCSRYPEAQDWVLHGGIEELQQFCQSMIHRPENAGFMVPVSELSHLFAAQKLPDPSSEWQETVQSAVRYLIFVKQYFSTLNVALLHHQATQFLAPALLLVMTREPRIVDTAKDAVFALLGFMSRVPANQTRIELATSEAIWTCITVLLDHGHASSCTSIAYQTWIRWLDLGPANSSLATHVQHDRYWSYLVGTLANGDAEQRKLCLQILRRSIVLACQSNSTVDTAHMQLPARPSSIGTRNRPAVCVRMPLDQAHASLGWLRNPRAFTLQNRPLINGTGQHKTQAQYERFCIVFETVVLGRYIGQIQECVGDLDALASDSTEVGKTWLFALLSPALSPTVQDSVRKMLGNWLMSVDLRLDQNYSGFTRLLESSFLPWATQGHLFTSSLRGDTKRMQCEHGNRLTSFLKSVLRANADASNALITRAIVRTVLRYLLANVNRIMSYAVIYALQGILAALTAEATLCLELEDLVTLLDLSRASSFQETARDLFQVQCHELCQFVPSDAISSSLTPVSQDTSAAIATKLAHLKDRVLQLKQVPTNGENLSSNRWQSLKDLAIDLDLTKCSCLKGSGLLDACRSMTEILDTFEPASDAAQMLQIAFDALWSEIEIQDYPKAALRLMPSLAFHPTYVGLSLSDEGLAEFLSLLVDQYRDLWKGRIYVFAPFMRALRSALLERPALAHALPLHDLIVQAANHPPSAKVEFQLEAAASNLLVAAGPAYSHLTYSRYYGDSERLGYAALFDIVDRLNAFDPQLCDDALDSILQPWIQQKAPVVIVNKWKTTQQLQVALLLSEQRLARSSVFDAKQHLDVFLRLLAVEPLPRFRFLLEWIITRCIVRHEALDDTILDALSTKDHHSNPKYLASLTKVAVMTACLDRTKSELGIRVASIVAALSTSSKIIIRHEAQWSFPILWDHAMAKGWNTLTNNPALLAIAEYIKSLDRFFEPMPMRELERLDPVKDHTLASLFQGGYLRLEPQGVEIVEWSDFEALWRDDKQNAHLPSQLPPLALPLGERPTQVMAPTQSLSETNIKSSARGEALTALQTKGTAYLATTKSAVEAATRPTDLIVVASLVDNPYNLGGLSRVSEIFGASALHMSNPGVTANKDFVAVAVSSHNHLQILGLPTADIVTFLARKKNEGYTVVGVEQTDRSVMLGAEATKLAAKTILLMGAEKEGIPALLLGECDMLVEVPQKGVTRSMNVQTAAACVLYEYARQHRGR